MKFQRDPAQFGQNLAGEVVQRGAQTTGADSLLSQALLVSRFRPEVSSLPMEMISALVMRFGSVG